MRFKFVSTAVAYFSLCTNLLNFLFVMGKTLGNYHTPASRIVNMCLLINIKNVKRKMSNTYLCFTVIFLNFNWKYLCVYSVCVPMCALVSVIWGQSRMPAHGWVWGCVPVCIRVCVFRTRAWTHTVTWLKWGILTWEKRNLSLTTGRLNVRGALHWWQLLLTSR